MALIDRAIVKLLPAVPKPVVQRISSRYIAGSELRDATRVVRELNARRKLATVDVLGEEVLDAEATRRFVDAYEDVLAAGLALALAALPFVAWGPLGPYNDREDVVRRRRPYAGYPRRVRRTTTIEEDDVSGPPAGPA